MTCLVCRRISSPRLLVAISTLDSGRKAPLCEQCNCDSFKRAEAERRVKP